MASKIDTVIDRLERLTNDVSQLKLGLIGLLPLPPIAKPIIRQGAEVLDPVITELYFDALRSGVDVARMPESQQAVKDVYANFANPPSIKKPRSRAQKKNDKMQSSAFKLANARLRTKAGALRKGLTQADVAKRAQKELKLMKRGARGTKRKKTSGTRKPPMRRTGGGRR